MKNIFKNRLERLSLPAKFFAKRKNFQFSIFSILNFPLIFALLLIVSSCELDNLAPPDGHLTGVIIDSVTRRQVLSEQPGGIDVYCNELKMIGDSIAFVGGGQGFTGRADGTFNNTKIFAGLYNVTVQGPFHAPSGQTVEIKSNQTTELSFTAVPYVSFSDVTIEKDPNNAGTIIAKFKLQTHTSFGNTSTIRSYRLFASLRTKYVGVNAFDDAVSSSDIALTPDKLGTEITVKRNGFEAGKTYYIRLGARSTESYQSRYNMTEIIEMKF